MKYRNGKHKHILISCLVLIMILAGGLFAWNIWTGTLDQDSGNIDHPSETTAQGDPHAEDAADDHTLDNDQSADQSNAEGKYAEQNKNKTDENKTGENKTGENKTGENKTDENNTDENNGGGNKAQSVDPDSKNQDLINQDANQIQANGTKGRSVFTAGQADSIAVELTASNVIVVNADTDLVMYQKNSTAQIAPASTAKMITALTALDICSKEEQVTVGAEITMMHDDSSRAWLNQGDVLSVRQLLIALLLPSGNDAAYTLAVHAGRKLAGDRDLADRQAVEVFMDAANKKAKALGAESSNFAVPDGYDADGQYTTAYDLAILAKACLEDACIAEIIASDRSYEKWTGGREVTYNNSNELLVPGSQFYYPEAVGIKTGTSSLAGASLVSAAAIDGETYISVVMGADSNESRFQDSIVIYDAIKTL